MDKFLCCCPCFSGKDKDKLSDAKGLFQRLESQIEEKIAHSEEALKQTAFGLVHQAEAAAEERMHKVLDEVEHVKVGVQSTMQTVQKVEHYVETEVQLVAKEADGMKTTVTETVAQLEGTEVKVVRTSPR